MNLYRLMLADEATDEVLPTRDVAALDTEAAARMITRMMREGLLPSTAVVVGIVPTSDDQPDMIAFTRRFE